MSTDPVLCKQRGARLKGGHPIVAGDFRTEEMGNLEHKAAATGTKLTTLNMLVTRGQRAASPGSPWSLVARKDTQH